MSSQIRSFSRSIGCSWLDQLPDEWEVMPIKYLAIGESSYFDDGDWIESKDIADSGIRYLTTGNVGQGVFKIQGSGFISEETFKSLGCKYVYPGDLLISRLNLPMGRACIVPRYEEKYVTAVDNVIFRPKKGISKHYLLFLFSSAPYFAHMKDLARGSTMVRVSRTILGNVRIPIPEYSEQIQIATYLNRETAKIDKLITKQQKLIKLLQEKRQAVISQAVTKGLDQNVKMKDSGVEWLGEVPEHWELVSLTRYLGKIVDYRGRTPTKSDSGVYLITARNIRKGYIDYDCSEEFILEDEYEDSMRRGKPEVGDLLFTMEAPLGNVALVDRTDVAIAQRVVKFRSMTEFLNSEYLMYSILGTYFQSQLETLATGSTALGLKASKLNQLRILRPPINEQILISQAVKAQLTKLSVLDKKAHEQIALLKEHRQALITATVTGKIDVRGLVTDEEVAALDADPVLETTEENFESEVVEADYITEDE